VPIRGALLLSLPLLAGCAEPEPVVIDGSSAERFERTSAAARRQLPDADRIVFDRALRTIGGRRHSERDPAALARVTFDGMTAKQVVADQKARQQ
jgi:hypothetical protein